MAGVNGDESLDLLARGDGLNGNGSAGLQPAEPLQADGQLNLVDEIETTLPDAEARELAQEWIGLPMFAEKEQVPRLSISFDSPEDRERFLREIGVTTIAKTTGSTLSVKWPERAREDLASLRFVASWEDA